MSADEDPRPALPLVLLTGPLAPPAGVTGLRSALEHLGPVLAPTLSPAGARPADLGGPALSVLAAVSAAGADEAVLCGVGLGAMVALHVAAAHPRRVAALVLTTCARPVATPVRSLHEGVTRALPARAVQVLGGGGPALDVLDQVRPVDYGPLAPLVTMPVLVLHGEQDPVNARASRRLARTLPDATSVAVPGAGPGWVWRDPGRYQAAATFFLLRHARR